MAAIADHFDSSQGTPPVSLRKENSKGLEALWWAMHHSDEAYRQAAIVTCYLDESGTHDTAPTAVVGGLLLDKAGFIGFDTAWEDEVLQKHGIQPPLHMKEFRRPDGRLADVSNEKRRALFTDVVKVINEHKVYSVASILTTAEYRKHFSPDHIKTIMGFYGICFILSLRLNHVIAFNNDYKGRIPLLLDSGNQYAEQVRAAHAATQEWDFPDMNVGSLTFDDDRLINALQAADVISWASRVRANGDSFTNGYEPLSGLFDPSHEQRRFSEVELSGIAEQMQHLGESSDQGIE